MSKIWKPVILAAVAITLFGAMYASQPFHLRAATAHSANVSAISIDEIMSRTGRLPATEIDPHAYE
jgi:hypothetical protein